MNISACQMVQPRNTLSIGPLQARVVLGFSTPGSLAAFSHLGLLTCTPAGGVEQTEAPSHPDPEPHLNLECGMLVVLSKRKLRPIRVLQSNQHHVPCFNKAC